MCVCVYQKTMPKKGELGKPTKKTTKNLQKTAKNVKCANVSIKSIETN